MSSSTSNTILSTEKLNCTTSTIDSPRSVSSIVGTYATYSPTFSNDSPIVSPMDSPRSVSSTVAIYATSPQYPIGSVDSPGSVSSTTYKNLCVVCGIDMGDQNPRQLCGKTICYGDF